jgi:hypothetical protein
MSHLGGKMLLFQGGVPSLGAGKFKARESLAAYGTEKEAGLRNPEDPFFKRWVFGGRVSEGGGDPLSRGRELGRGPGVSHSIRWGG